jgi:alkylation response protein AidB-like acyl-CoA dehydrogenase
MTSTIARKATKATGNMDLIGIVKEISSDFLARSEANDAEGRVSAENFEKIREKKLFSVRIPIELGGGATHAEVTEMIRELVHYDSSTALAFSMQSHLIVTLIWRVKKGLMPSLEPAPQQDSR